MPSPGVLPAVEVQTSDTPDATVIWLHGLGADGHDFEGVVPMLELPAGSAVRFVFPHAPVRPVTLNGGAPMRAWYDIYGIGPEYPQDEPGIAEADQHLGALIARECRRGIAVQRIVLAGFSQGGSMALYTGVRYPEPLAGAVALSAWLPLRGKLAGERHPANAHLPILLMHGTEDPVVPTAYAQAAREALVSAGYPVDWRTFPMPHTVVAEQLTDIGLWLGARLGLG